MALHGIWIHVKKGLLHGRLESGPGSRPYNARITPNIGRQKVKRMLNFLQVIKFCRICYISGSISIHIPAKS